MDQPGPLRNDDEELSCCSGRSSAAVTPEREIPNRELTAEEKEIKEREEKAQRNAYLEKIAGPMPYQFPPLPPHQIARMPLYSAIEDKFEKGGKRTELKEQLSEKLKNTNWKANVQAQIDKYMEEHPDWTCEEIVGIGRAIGKKEVPKEVAVDLYKACAEFCWKAFEDRY
ncbi:hypothetical protein QR680_000168 [Steinernema hermaphroditum]|uniref:Uncharacterized protein n=1 Tax=Steinernema hermaphroditum TaxID=289476 RepID=A0AA39GWF2_9BILA|nr:hypothetical protein QR680_000168 [Steinernema hermaphroditum]